MKSILIQNITTPLDKPITAGYADTFFGKFRGLMLYSAIAPYQGILLVEKYESRMNTAIHMLFMNFDIAAIWIDKNNRIVDLRLARKWQPLYMSKRPAQYVLETHPIHLTEFSPGDEVMLKYA